MVGVLLYGGGGGEVYCNMVGVTGIVINVIEVGRHTV